MRGKIPIVQGIVNLEEVEPLQTTAQTALPMKHGWR
jgi:hypothetical protein